MPMTRSILALAVLLAACSNDRPITSAPGPTCDPTMTVAPTIVSLRTGGSTTVVATVVPCGLARKTTWVATDPSIAGVSVTSDTTATITGGKAGNTTVLASVAAFPGAHGVVVVQVQ